MAYPDVYKQLLDFVTDDWPASRSSVRLAASASSSAAKQFDLVTVQVA